MEDKKHILLKKSGRISKVEATNKSKIERLKNDGFVEVVKDDKCNLVVKETNETIADLKKELADLKKTKIAKKDFEALQAQVAELTAQLDAEKATNAELTAQLDAAKK